MMANEAHQKVAARHLKRDAYLNVRQKCDQGRARTHRCLRSR